jgi:hypothetical protein
MIYTHVMADGVAGVRSPLDLLDDLVPEDVQAAMDAGRAANGRPANVVHTAEV